MFWNLDLDLWNTKFAGNPYNFVYKPIIIGLINHPQVYENNGTLDSIIAHISQKSDVFLQNLGEFHVTSWTTRSGLPASSEAAFRFRQTRRGSYRQESGDLESTPPEN